MKKVNFFEVVSSEKKPKFEIDIQDPFTKKMAIAAIALFVISMSVFVIRFHEYRGLKKDYEEQQAVLSSQDYIDTVAKDKELTNQILANQYNLLVIDSIQSYVDTAMELETSYISLILSVKPANVEIESFSYAEGVIEISCSTPNDMYPADFTKALEETGAFESVQYNGFTRSTEDEVVFPISCTLKPQTEVGEE